MEGGEPAGGHCPAWAVDTVRRATAREGQPVDRSPDTGTDRPDGVRQHNLIGSP